MRFDIGSLMKDISATTWSYSFPLVSTKNILDNMKRHIYFMKMYFNEIYNQKHSWVKFFIISKNQASIDIKNQDEKSIITC